MVGLNILPTQLTGEASGVLLVLSAEEESARRIESHLRNAGYPLRAAWAADLEELEDILRRNPPDLLLCENKLPAAPMERVIVLCRSLTPDLPLLLLGDRPEPDAIAEALAAGAQDCVCSRDSAHLRHLEHVVVREFINHHHVRELKFTRERLQEFRSRHQQLTEGTGDAVAHLQEGILVGANTAFAQLLGHDNATALVGTPLIDLVVPEQQNRIKERLRQMLKGKHNGEPLELALAGRAGRVDLKAKLILGSADGETSIEMLVRSPPPAEHGGGTAGGRAALGRALNHLGPDGVLRAALLVKIDAYADLEARIGMIDAEEIRDRIGAAIRERLQDGDALFVFSTDELGLLIARREIGEIETFGETLRAGLSRQIFTTQRHEAQIMASIAAYPLGEHEQVENVVQQLAAEVRRLSREGGDRLSVLGVAAKARMAEREDARVAAQVGKALEENRLKLAYQVIASLEGESNRRFDVLLRMIDAGGNEIHAGEFLPQAQKAGKMRMIDRWVVAHVLGMLSKRAGAQTLFFKLSEDSVRDGEDFLAWFRKQLEEHPPRPDTLVVELQELAAQNHIRKAKALTQGLRELGVGIALEQFGLGASSIPMLAHIPAQYLKFHPDFTRRFGEKEIQRRFGDLMTASRQRQLKTIVVHVEDAGVMARMWQMGVNFVQGFHVQEPEAVPIIGEISERGA